MAVIVAVMADGTRIVELAKDFAAFTGLVLAFKRDADVVSLTWDRLPSDAAQLAAPAA